MQFTDAELEQYRRTKAAVRAAARATGDVGPWTLRLPDTAGMLAEWRHERWPLAVRVKLVKVVAQSEHAPYALLYKYPDGTCRPPEEKPAAWGGYTAGRVAASTDPDTFREEAAAWLADHPDPREQFTGDLVNIVTGRPRGTA
jgi:hypothetical protein